ncbi:MAG: polyprenyl synthetase family protein [Zoogloeaceae bacterium]|jgi:farnesyl diphosphate synthase|nr:polyprenyl synthetase family protein [Zoogloeaceae bacterium]
MTDFPAWMISVQQDVEKHLNETLPRANAIPDTLHEAMRYSVLGGGKRVRALLVFAAGDLVKAERSPLLASASAVELIHAYSLIHDDLPAMDDDAMRRGRPSCHIAFDEATALLAGDALQSLAFLCLTEPGLFGASQSEQQLQAIKTLAHAAGSLGMAGGQAVDLASVGKTLTRPELELMHAMKTGALIRASIRLGALCGQLSDLGEPEKTRAFDQLDHFANRVGLLFQVVDDILDCTAESATLGKTAGKDAAADKPTYVRLLGLDEAKRYAGELREEARLALTHPALAPFGTGGRRLAELTDFICDRRF